MSAPINFSAGYGSSLLKLWVVKPFLTALLPAGSVTEVLFGHGTRCGQSANANSIFVENITIRKINVLFIIYHLEQQNVANFEYLNRLDIPFISHKSGLWDLILLQGRNCGYWRSATLGFRAGNQTIRCR